MHTADKKVRNADDVALMRSPPGLLGLLLHDIEFTLYLQINAETMRCSFANPHPVIVIILYFTA